MILEKICRYCETCDLLIVHRDQLEEQLTSHLLMIDPEVVGNDYLVIGTLDSTEWNRMKHQEQSLRQIAEHLHDFKEVAMFSREPLE